MALFGGIELPDRPDPENIRKLDLLPMPMIRKMMRYGMELDLDHLRAFSADLNRRMDALRLDILNEIPPESLDRFVELYPERDLSELEDLPEGSYPDEKEQQFQVESSQKVAELLYDVLGLQNKGVQVKKTKGGKYSTGKKTLEQLKRDHPVVPLILDYRQCSKLDGTYAKSMPRRAILHPKGKDCPICGRFHWEPSWRVHTQITTTRTATGRTASKNPNLANIPIRTKDGARIRAAFVASQGHVIAQRDWAQIELRLMADRSGDPTMIDIYAADGDIHIETAIRTFQLDNDFIYDLLRKDNAGTLTESEEKEWKHFKLFERAPSKNTNFAVCYLITGMGLLDLMAVTFSTAGERLPDYMDEAWCDGFIDKWFDIYSGVRSYLQDEEVKIRQFGIAWTPCGRVRRIPEVRSYFGYIQEAGVRQGSNHGIQGYSADIMKLAMGEVQARLDVLERDYHILTFPMISIYDELLIESEEDDGETVEAVLEEVMDGVLTDKSTGERLCKVPIKSDGHCMVRWEKN